MLDLDSYLPYLLNRAGARLAERFSGVLDEHGVTLAMWRVMAALHHRDGQRVGQLAEMISIEVSTLSRLLGAMARKGLVSRERPAADGRTVVVSLTEAGDRMTRRIVPIALRYEAIALNGFSAEDARALRRMLVRVFGNLDLLDRGARPALRRKPRAKAKKRISARPEIHYNLGHGAKGRRTK